MNIVVKVKSAIVDAILEKNSCYFVTKMFPQRYDKESDVVFIVNEETSKMIGYAVGVNVYMTTDVKPVIEALKKAVGVSKRGCLSEYNNKKKITVWSLQSITLVNPAPVWKSKFYDSVFPMEFYNTKVNPDWYGIAAYKLKVINF